MIGPFLTSLRYSRVLGQKGSINKDFEKLKIKIAGIHLIYNCAEFQDDLCYF